MFVYPTSRRDQKLFAHCETKFYYLKIPEIDI